MLCGSHQEQIQQPFPVSIALPKAFVEICPFFKIIIISIFRVWILNYFEFESWTTSSLDLELLAQFSSHHNDLAYFIMYYSRCLLVILCPLRNSWTAWNISKEQTFTASRRCAECTFRTAYFKVKVTLRGRKVIWQRYICNALVMICLIFYDKVG